MDGSNSLKEYRKARKQGLREVERLRKAGSSPWPAVLDEVYGEVMAGGVLALGLHDIPIELIVGTKSRGRQEAFSAGFLPLLEPETEFGGKWMHLYDQLSSEGLRDPLECYECWGRLYVAEGNKRLSVLKYNGAVDVPVNVTRVLTIPSEDPADRLYRDFLSIYRCTHSYFVHFSIPGQFPKLQAALGFDADHVWSSEDRSRFRAGYERFARARAKARKEKADLPSLDALILWLHFYPFSQLKEMTEKELKTSIEGLDLKLEQLAELSIPCMPYPEEGLNS